MTDSSRRVTACLDGLSLRLPIVGVGEGDLKVCSPIDAQPLAQLRTSSEADAAQSIRALQRDRPAWAALAAARRGNVLHGFANRLRAGSDALACLITLETGKVTTEALAEVQQVIDECRSTVERLQRLPGLATATEAPAPSTFEDWRPVGICGVIGAFDAPVASWAGDAVWALACGNGVVAKPSRKTPLSAMAAHGLLQAALADAEPGFAHVAQLWIGGAEQGAWLVDHPAVQVIGATGSLDAVRALAVRCAAQFKPGFFAPPGNHAAIVRPSADPAATARAIVRDATGTNGQGCAALRRVFVHSDVYDVLLARLRVAYADLHVGHPAEPGTQIGPLIDAAAHAAMAATLADCAQRGNRVSGGERLNAELLPRAYYVRPALVETEVQHDTMKTQIAAPILYLQRVDDLDDAVALTNAVTYGRSSCLFTESRTEAQRYVSQIGSGGGVVSMHIGSAGAAQGESGAEEDVGADVFGRHLRRTTRTARLGTTQPLSPTLQFDR